MTSLVLDYVPYFNAMRAYTETPPARREALHERFFTAVIAMETNHKVQQALIARAAKEAALFASQGQEVNQK